MQITLAEHKHDHITNNDGDGTNLISLNAHKPHLTTEWHQDRLV